MSARVATGVGADDTVLAVKAARGQAEVERLAHEATILRAARHPGVVELVAFERSGEGVSATAELRTVFVATHSLATVGPVPLERAAGLVAATAAVVADLHEIGIVHGRIDPSHVIVGAEGRPVLCGFSAAGRPGQVPPPAPPSPPELVDPACPPASPLVQATDLFGLGSLLRYLVGTADDPARHGLARRKQLSRRQHRRALLTLADQATAENPRLRPTARAFATAIGQSVPTATLTAAPPPETVAPPRPPAPARGGAPGSSVGRVLRGLLILGGLTAVIVGVQQLSTAGGSTQPPPTASPATTGARPAPESGAAPSTAGPSTVPTTQLGGTPPVVEAGGVRYAVGLPGDQLAVGDWDCDGLATAAVVRPTTGEIFVFPAWAGSEPITVAARTRLPGARDPRGEDADGDGCHRLVVSDADGRAVEVTL